MGQHRTRNSPWNRVLVGIHPSSEKLHYESPFGEREPISFHSRNSHTMNGIEGSHLYDLSGEDPLIRILFFLFVAGAILCGFYLVFRFGKREEMYVHPCVKRLIDSIRRNR